MYAQQSKQRIRWVRAAIALGSAASFGAVMAGLLPAARWLGLDIGLDERALAQWVLGQTAKIPFFGEIGRALLRPALEGTPWLTAAALGAAVGWFAGRARAEAWHDRFLAPFNDEVLQPVRTPRAFDPLRGAAGLDAVSPALPWTLPDDGPRHELWNQLTSFSRSGAEPVDTKDGRRPSVPFGWTILMGRPGSGKSRLAVEFARHLAQRARLGGNKKEPFRERLSRWWRIAVQLEFCRETDPWDAGWLLAGEAPSHLQGAYPGWTARAKVDPIRREALKAWRPRRPTLLLLDDPHLGDAKAVIEELEVQSRQFRHPVRLLIVNQSAPTELNLKHDRNGWSVDGGTQALAAPLILDDAARFTESDIRQIVSAPGFSWNGHPLRDRVNIADFLRVTQGNPLLVELGFRWLRSGGRLDEMTEDRLLADRVERILAAMQEAGLGSAEHRRALATASLSGGVAERAVLKNAFPFHETGEELVRLFPFETEMLRNGLPPVRPELIGFAFARHVFESEENHIQKRIVELAWVANATGTLRAALRLGGQHHPLGDRLALGPPNDAAIEPYSLAVAYIDASAILPNSDDVSQIEIAAARKRQPAALRLINKLEGQSTFLILAHIFGIIDSKQSNIEENGLRQIIISAFDRFTQAVEIRSIGATVRMNNIDEWKNFWAVAFGRSEWQTHEVINISKMAERKNCENIAYGIGQALPLFHQIMNMNFECLDHDFRMMVAIASLLRAGPPGPIEGLALRIDSIAQGKDAPSGVWNARVDAWLFVAIACKSDAARATAAAERVGAIVGSNPSWANERLMNVKRAEAWVAAACARNQPRAGRLDAARRVEAIIAESPSGDRDHAMQLSRAQAWMAVAYACMDDPLGAVSSAQQVDAIVDTVPCWARDYEMQLVRAKVWRAVIGAQIDAKNQKDAIFFLNKVEEILSLDDSWRKDFNLNFELLAALTNFACLHHNEEKLRELLSRANDIISLESSWLEERSMNMEYADIAARLVYSLKEDRLGAERAAKEVEAIVRPLLLIDPACESRRFLARSWRIVAYARRNDPDACMEAARWVDAVVQEHPQGMADEELAFEVAHAWRCVAAARPPNAGRAELAADRVDKAARASDAWALKKRFQIERAEAWDSVAEAYALEGKLEQARACALRVEEATTRNPDWLTDLEMQVWHVRAWSLVAMAASPRPNEAASAALKTDEIASRVLAWKREHRIQCMRAEAWRFVAYAYQEDLANARRAAERVDEVASADDSWATDRDMQLTRSNAWRHVAFAARATPDAAREAVSVVERIAASVRAWANDRDFAYSQAWALSSLTHALDPNSPEYRSAYVRLDKLVSRFWPDPELARALQAARRIGGGDGGI